jgi:hypothetical protein
MDTPDLISYYVGLLILQYIGMNNAQSEITLLASEFIQNQIIEQFVDSLDVTTAVGAQLDILGTFRGISRNAFGLTPRNYWALPSYTNSAPGNYFGWGTYANPPSNDYWLVYNDLNNLAYALTDAQMRLLIQLKADFDSWDGTYGSMDTILYEYFTTNVNLVDNGNMTIVYQHNNADPDPNQLFDIAVLENVLPAPAGVSYTVVEV